MLSTQLTKNTVRKIGQFYGKSDEKHSDLFQSKRRLGMIYKRIVSFSLKMVSHWGKC